MNAIFQQILLQLDNREDKSSCNNLISNSRSACKVKYNDYSKYGYGNPKRTEDCTPGEEKSSTCQICNFYIECTGTCISLVDWCNKNGKWITAKKEIECQGTNESTFLPVVYYVWCK